MPNRSVQTDPAKKTTAAKKKAPAARQPTTGDTPDEAQEAAPSTPWDALDESSLETFPASDAPASWAGRDIAPQDRDDAHKKS